MTRATDPVFSQLPSPGLKYRLETSVKQRSPYSSGLQPAVANQSHPGRGRTSTSSN